MTTQIAFKPNWTAEGKAAPFKRNDRMLDVLPIGLVVFPGSGITDNLANKETAVLPLQAIPFADFCNKIGQQRTLAAGDWRS